MLRAVLGGSFDPVHNGHVALAQRVLDDGLAQEIRVLPAWRSPLKDTAGADADHRLAMVKLAFADLPDVVLDDREIQYSKPTFTVDTLAQMKNQWPADQLRLIIGADNMAVFEHWQDPHRILDLAELLVLAREDSKPMACALDQSAWPTNRIIHIKDFYVPVSSTDIRAKLAAGELPTGLMSDSVIDYIVDHGLYGL